MRKQEQDVKLLMVDGEQEQGNRADGSGSVFSHIGAIEVENVAKTYENGTVALRGVSFRVDSGQFVALLGPSGSGKTTLLGLVAGFVPMGTGTIRIGGREVSRIPPYERELGVVFQDYALFPHMSVRENIAFPLEARRQSPQEIDRAVSLVLELVDLADYGNRMPSQLSGGQQQRIALARALVFKPSILLLDEPLGSLDRRLRDAMQSELSRLHSRLGISFLYVTHDQEEALGMADMLIVLNRGSIEQVGTPTQVYENPRNAFVANFIGDCNIWRGRVEPSGRGCAIRDPDTGVVLYQGDSAEVDLSQPVLEVAIRPEWISVEIGDGPKAPTPGRLRATIAQMRYHGRELVLECDTPLGRALVLERGRKATELALKEGGRVLLNWDPGKAVPLIGNDKQG